MKKPQLNSKSIITQKEFENGIWQFIIDHSVPVDEKLRIVKFNATTQEDLMSRIYSRATLVYKIKNEEQIEKENAKKIGQYRYLLSQHHKSNRLQEKIEKLKKNNILKYKILRYVRIFRDYLIERWAK